MPMDRPPTQRLYTLALLWALLPTASAAATSQSADPSGLCEAAALVASAQEGVPISVLTAISLNESGRKQGGSFRAWPWTVNMEGAGHWFDSPEEGLAYAQKEYDRGARSFDVGCFQINYRWHGEHFTSIAQMFDPLANALYAARFLRELYAEQGSWEGAAGAYHSRNPQFAEGYAARFSRFRGDFLNRNGETLPAIPDLQLAELTSAGVSPLPFGQPEQRPNTFPLLQAGAGAGFGSLVPISNGQAMALFDQPAQPTAEAP